MPLDHDLGTWILLDGRGNRVESWLRPPFQHISVKIEQQVLDDLKAGELEVTMLEDLVASGVNAALSKARELMQQEMGKLTGGLRIPGLF